MKQTSYIKKIYLFICTLILGLISGCRFSLDGDFYTNYIGFIKTSDLRFKDIFTSSEFGHLLFRKVISLFTTNPQWYFAISSVFIIVSFFIFFHRYSPNIYISILLFVTLTIYFYTHNITRQYIAISICLYAIPFLLDRKFWRYLIIILIAMTFHTSAIIMIVLYFIANIPIKLITILNYIVSISIVLILFYQVLNFVQRFIYYNYSNESYGMIPSNKLNIVLPIIQLIFAFCLYRYNNAKALNKLDSSGELTDKKVNARLDNLLIHMSLLAFCCSLLSIKYSLILDRLGCYFTVCYPILGLRFSQVLPANKRRLLNIGIIFISIIYFLINNYTGRLTPTPYTPFWRY